MALVFSQAQQQSDLKGDTGAIGAQGDSTAGHGFNSGTIVLPTGSAPADANATQSGTNLATVTLPNPCFGAPSAATPSVLTANAITSVTISNTGTVGYGRMCAQGDTGASSTSERRIQFTVGTSGADMNFNTTSFVSGGTLTITALTITHG